MLIRVLLTAGHAVVRRQLRSLLEAEPHCEVCGEAEDSDEAVRLAKLLRPDVVVLDHAVPDRRGLDAAQQIKATLPRSRVLVISAHEVDGYANALVPAGIAEWLPRHETARRLLPAVLASPHARVDGTAAIECGGKGAGWQA